MAAFFAKPTIAKAAPAYGVTAAEFCGFSLNDVLIMLTIIYTLLLLFNALPGAWNGVKFLLNARYRRDREKQRGERLKKKSPARAGTLPGMERIITET